MTAMTRLKTLVVVASLVMFAAGTVVGMLLRGAARDPSPSYLARELDLTDDQRERMRAIWTKAMADAPPPPDEQMRRIERERQEAVRKLLAPERAAEYAELQRHYDEQILDLDKKARAAFRDAEDQTRQLLTERQRAKFQELIRTREGRRVILQVGDRGRGPATGENK